MALCPALHAAKIRATADPVADELPITEKDRAHWAFTPLQRPTPPAVRDATAARNEIDHFILAKLEAAGLGFAPEADAATLIRRVTFDLTGLPPTSEEVQAFVRAAGESDKAYELLVDRLLSSPRYGEAWAQHWLDLARYAETDGFEHDRERERAWRYRDWVIHALNRDLPFDEFTRLQIAGDELGGDDDALMATGFLFAGPDMPDLNNQDERRHVVLNEITSTVGSAFLGLTMACAQCHDHLYDPVSQADFYRLRAFFDHTVQTARDKQIGPVAREPGRDAAASHVFIRGVFDRPGPQIAPAFPRIANPENAPADINATTDSSGRRAALARWLANKDNALFLRVIANRLWQHHLVRPLAGTPSDFGHQGEPPTHPELLDWLATELPRRGWSLKQMHRLIVTSAAYRQTSTTSKNNDHMAAAIERDPDNALLSRMNRRRLSGETLHDAMLALTGRLNLKAGGPGVKMPLAPEVAAMISKAKHVADPDPAEHQRRGIYLFARRNLRQPIFDLFDRPDALTSCARRTESTTAPQALLMLNSEFSQDTARRIADLVANEHGSDPAACITTAVWRCLSRAPSASELTLGEKFLTDQSRHTSDFRAALADYCLGLLNTSSFCFVD